MSPGSAKDDPKSSSVVLSDTHQVSISQQMSRVIAFDIVVGAQKVKVVNEDWCDLKKLDGVATRVPDGAIKGGSSPVQGRSEYFLKRRPALAQHCCNLALFDF